MTDTPRPLRRDAERNLERVLAAAVAVFAEEGLDASIERVARRAEVGLATIYRRFATKQALVDELARRLLEDVVSASERHLRDPDGTGLTNYLWEAGELLAANRGLVSRMWNVPGAPGILERSGRAGALLLEQAQRHGLARPELTAEDIAVVLWAVHGVLDVTRGVPAGGWRRHLELLVAGLRPDGRALSEPPLSLAELDAVARRGTSTAPTRKAVGPGHPLTPAARPRTTART